MSVSASAARLISSGKQITSRGLAPPSAHQVPNSNFQIPNSKFDSLQEQQLPTTCAIHCAPFERAQLTTQIERALMSSNDGTSKFQLPKSSPRSGVRGPDSISTRKFQVRNSSGPLQQIPSSTPHSTLKFQIRNSRVKITRRKTQKKNSPDSKFWSPLQSKDFLLLN